MCIRDLMICSAVPQTTLYSLRLINLYRFVTIFVFMFYRYNIFERVWLLRLRFSTRHNFPHYSQKRCRVYVEYRLIYLFAQRGVCIWVLNLSPLSHSPSLFFFRFLSSFYGRLSHVSVLWSTVRFSSTEFSNNRHCLSSSAFLVVTCENIHR